MRGQWKRGGREGYGGRRVELVVFDTGDWHERTAESEGGEEVQRRGTGRGEARQSCPSRYALRNADGSR